MIRTLTMEPPFAGAESLIHAASTTDRDLERSVRDIVDDVASRGDAALLEYTSRFDRVEAADVAALRVPDAELEAAAEALDPALLNTMRRAAERIRGFHARQVERGFLDLQPDGTLLGQRVVPLATVGVYVPGDGPPTRPPC